MNIGDIVQIKSNSTYTNGRKIPYSFIRQQWTVSSITDHIALLRNESSVTLKIDIDNLIIVKSKPVHIFRVCKSLTDKPNLIQQFSRVEFAKAACDMKGVGYSIFDENNINIYTVEPTSFKIGDELSLTFDAIYTTGQIVPEHIINTKVYCRGIRHGNYIISDKKVGKLLGMVKPSYVVKYGLSQSGLRPYIAISKEETIKIYEEPDFNSEIAITYNDQRPLGIVEERDNWGKLKDHIGWIDLTNVKKL